jgi:hypothetical protein
MNKASDAEQQRRLERLAALPDDAIDTSDLPVVEDWSDGVRGGTPADVRRKMAARQPGGAVPLDPVAPAPLEAFIRRWQGREGGQERANYALFLSELCDAIGVPRPDPAAQDTAGNDYVFERTVDEPDGQGSVSHRRIDLYKRNCFVLEAKQSRQKGGKKEVLGQPSLFATAEPSRRGARTASRAWDVLMLNARRQAEGYARALPVSHGWPPFILVCDVGHVLEVYADFSGQGKNYAQFPDRQSFRIYLEDLRDSAVRERLVQIWTDPLTLDPARKSARVTRAIAERLAAVSKALEAAQHPPEEVAMFLMRCLFTMFAQSVGLLPKDSFRDLLQRCEQNPDRLRPMVGQLWEAMDRGDFAIAIEARVKRFNGEFFKTRTVLPLAREEIGELRQAAGYDWREVDPSIFGTLLEQALDKQERRRLGAHYTPRAYVERLVVATIMEPLRADWDRALSTAERQKSEGRLKDSVTTIAAFHETLCRTRILDPACGTGNFLYVSLELLKRLEGEVLEALSDLGGQEALHGLEGHTVDPHQFLGLEINPRAAAIAELVLWIGYLQWHLRTQSGFPSEPILRAFHNIAVKDAVLEAKVSLARDGSGKPVTRVAPDGTEVEVYRYDNPRQPEWPEAEFIVGNPPFIGSKLLRARLGDSYTEALWTAHKAMNESADFVMYWWDHAANILASKGNVLKRFGFVTTNSITQAFQSQVVHRHLTAGNPISIRMAIPDHPWMKMSSDSAAVRIAMTVCQPGVSEGMLKHVIVETGLDSDSPIVDLSEREGRINSDLTIGLNVSGAKRLLANEGVCARGVNLHGAGFILTRPQADLLGLGRRSGLDRHIREYRNGRDLTARPRGVLVIDLFGLDSGEIRRRFPEIYQHLTLEVKEKIIKDPDGTVRYVGRDWNNRDYRRRNWWLFGENNPELRNALRGLPRYIASPATQKHRTFEFLSGTILPDDALIVIALSDAFVLGILQSHAFAVWFAATSSTLEDRPRFINSRCFDPFPFPAATNLQERHIGAIAEELDSHRKRVLAEHPHLTLTGLYNVLEKLRAGTSPDALTPPDRRIFDDGLVLILKELHDRLDAAVAAAYGWPADLSDNEILTRLVALNRERAQEEARGLVRWLRPDYQIPRFGTVQQKAELVLEGGAMRETQPAEAAGPKPAFPTDETAQTAAVMAALASAPAPLDAASLAARFRQGRRVVPKVGSVLGSLQRMGFVHSADAGRTWLLRRIA